MNEKHHPLGPSNYPAWAKCPCYDNAQAGKSDDATQGKAIHAEVEAYFTSGKEPTTDEATWAVEKIREMSGGAEVTCEVVVASPESSSLGLRYAGASVKCPSKNRRSRSNESRSNEMGVCRGRVLRPCVDCRHGQMGWRRLPCRACRICGGRLGCREDGGGEVKAINSCK